MNEHSLPKNPRTPRSGRAADDERARADRDAPADGGGREETRAGDRWRSLAPREEAPQPGQNRLPQRADAIDYLVDPAETAGGRGTIDFRKWLWLLIKHRWLMLGTVVAFLFLGLVVTFLTKPIYRATTTLQISREAPNVTNVQDVDQNNNANADAEFYQTQYELLKSRSLADRVVQTLVLQDNSAFMTGKANSPWSRLKGLFFGSRSKSAAASASDIAARQKTAADKVLGGLGVDPVRSSSIVAVSYENPDPRLAQRIVNAIADSYIAINLERRYDASAYARTFLQDRLQQLKQKLEESEKDAVAYAEQQNIDIVGVGAGNKETMIQASLSSANQDLAKASTDRLRAELLWQQAQTTDGLDLPQILQDPSVQKLRATRADLAGQYQDKLASFKPAYPEMKQLQSQIDELDRQINAQVTLIKNSIKAQYDAAVSTETSLEGRVEDLKKQVADFQNRNIQYNILQREVDTNRQLYDGLLQRYKEIGVAGGVGINNISVVDKAEIPDAPYKPRLSVNLAIALMLGLLAGVAAALVREQLGDTFESPEDVEASLGVALLGIIPLVRDQAERTRALGDPHSELAESYRSLCTTLQFSTASGIPKILHVTSPRASEGKSTTAAAIARNLALLGNKVLLIDADLRRPSLHRHFNVPNDSGLSNCLVGTAVPPDVFKKSDVRGLTLIACGPLPHNPVELLSGHRMLSLLTVASEEYDIVVVDGPPVAGLADAPLLASMAVGTVLVVDASSTRRRAATVALRRLQYARGRVIGAVINKVDVAQRAYGYAYGYGYHDYYGAQENERLPATENALSGFLARLKGS
jgi:capsular exopolysaccharide synthesis family protein